MLALRESVEVCVGVLMANIVRCLQFWARIGCPLRLVVSETTAFKFLDPLSGIATYPSGALRRAGMSSGSAIDIAVCDGRRGRRGTIWSGVAMHRSRAVLLTPDDSRAVVLADLQIVLSAFSVFPEPLDAPAPPRINTAVAD